MHILAFADLHAQKRPMEELHRKSSKADVIIAAGDISLFGRHLKEVMGFLASLPCPVVMIHGNHEEDDEIRAFPASNLHFIHRVPWSYQGVLFLGWGGGGFAHVDQEFEQCAFSAYATLCKKSKKVVFVTHQPPYGTALDNLYGYSVGNKSFRSFIQHAQPQLAISGHIHETARKTDMLGKTKLINPGNEGMMITV